MASPQAAALDERHDRFLAALAANPQKELDELRDRPERCGDVATDPGGVDYFEDTVGGTIRVRPKLGLEARAAA